PEPGKTTLYDDSQTIDLDTVPLNGGFLIKTLVLSIDPYLRGKMRDPSVKSYSPPYTLGQPYANFGVGRVLRSEHSAVKAGDHVYGVLPFQEYTVVAEPARLGPDIFRVLENKEGLPWSAYVGVCGMPGEYIASRVQEIWTGVARRVDHLAHGAGTMTRIRQRLPILHALALFKFRKYGLTSRGEVGPLARDLVHVQWRELRT
ncbi:hypothetical protein FOMPIDRAFT_1124261, partial [Fomitopsis schrenkii]